MRPYAGPLGGSGGIDGTIALAEFALMNLPAAMILLLVSVNFAVLVYTRTAMRHGEIAVRTALGAGRGRIVAQLFIEALVLSAAGTVTGLAIAAIAIRQVSAATLGIRSELPFWLSLRISPESVLYAGLLAVIAAAIVGVVPAIKATKGGVGNVRITVDGSGMRLGRTWTLLIIAQVGFTVTLLPAAAYNAWENVRAEFVDPGFPADEYLTASLGMDEIEPARGRTPGTTEFTRRYAEAHTELMRRLESEAGLSDATFAMVLPGSESTTLIDTEASTRLPGGPEPTSGHVVRSNRVDVEFFSALDVGILAGRGFGPADAAGVDGSAVVVSESFAREIVGGDALGRRIRYTGRTDDVWYEIVGIVPDIPAGVSTGMLETRAKLYHPVAAGEVVPAILALRVRDGAPETFAQRLARIAADVDPALHVVNVFSLNEALHREQWIRRMEAGILGAVALSVLLLSSAGIYALMSFTVSKRRREIGIRMALGADRGRVIASIFSRALAQLAVGVVLGVVVAGALETGADFMKGNAVVVLPVMAFFMMGVGVLAAVGPARRCLGIEPIEALREE